MTWNLKQLWCGPFWVRTSCAKEVFYAVWRVPQCLPTSAGNQGVSWVSDRVDELEVAIGYRCFGTLWPYKVTTPTFTSLKEINEGGTVALEVTYEGNKSNGDFIGTVRYQRCSESGALFPGPAKEKVLPESSEKNDWTPLRFFPSCGKFMSDRVTAGGESYSAVPSKVAQWLLGKPFGGLISVKQGIPQTCAPIRFLQEREDGLWVKYQSDRLEKSDKLDWVCTTRGKGGQVGEEKKCFTKAVKFFRDSPKKNWPEENTIIKLHRSPYPQDGD